MSNVNSIVLFIFVLVLFIGFSFVPNAKAASAECDEIVCAAEPTCFCAYGGKALNHVRYTSCDFIKVMDEPMIQQNLMRIENFYMPVAQCNRNEHPIVAPSAIEGNEAYCRCQIIDK